MNIEVKEINKKYNLEYITILVNLLFLIFLLEISASAQQFTTKETISIHNAVDDLFSKYREFSDFRQEGEFSTEKMIRFKRILTANCEIFNDLEELDEVQERSMLRIDDYIARAKTLYPNGVLFDIKNMQWRGIVKSDHKTYIFFLLFTKSVWGENEDITNQIEMLIKFDIDDNDFTNFKIDRIAKQPYYIDKKPLDQNQSGQITVNEDNSLIKNTFIDEISLELGISSNSYNYGLLNNPLNALQDLSFYNSLMNNNIQLQIEKEIKSGFSIVSAIGIGRYHIKMVADEYSTSYSDFDIGDEEYVRLINVSNITESYENLMVSLGMGVNYLIPYKLKKFQFNINGLLNYSILNNSAFEARASVLYRGRYDDYNVVLHDIPSYGFYSEDAFYAGDMKLFSNLSFEIKPQISYPLSKTSDVFIAYSIKYGHFIFSNPSKDLSIFHHINEYKPIISSFDKVSFIENGLFFGIQSKL